MDTYDEDAIRACLSISEAVASFVAIRDELNKARARLEECVMHASADLARAPARAAKASSQAPVAVATGKVAETRITAAARPPGAFDQTIKQ